MSVRAGWQGLAPDVLAGEPEGGGKKTYVDPAPERNTARTRSGGESDVDGSSGRESRGRGRTVRGSTESAVRGPNASHPAPPPGLPVACMLRSLSRLRGARGEAEQGRRREQQYVVDCMVSGGDKRAAREKRRFQVPGIDARRVPPLNRSSNVRTTLLSVPTACYPVPTAPLQYSLHALRLP